MNHSPCSATAQANTSIIAMHGTCDFLQLPRKLQARFRPPMENSMYLSAVRIRKSGKSHIAAYGKAGFPWAVLPRVFPDHPRPRPGRLTESR